MDLQRAHSLPSPAVKAARWQRTMAFCRGTRSNMSDGAWLSLSLRVLEFAEHEKRSPTRSGGASDLCLACTKPKLLPWQPLSAACLAAACGVPTNQNDKSSTLIPSHFHRGLFHCRRCVTTEICAPSTRMLSRENTHKQECMFLIWHERTRVRKMHLFLCFYGRDGNKRHKNSQTRKGEKNSSLTQRSWCTCRPCADESASSNATFGGDTYTYKYKYTYLCIKKSRGICKRFPTLATNKKWVAWLYRSLWENNATSL